MGGLRRRVFVVEFVAFLAVEFPVVGGGGVERESLVVLSVQVVRIRKNVLNLVLCSTQRMNESYIL